MCSKFWPHFCQCFKSLASKTLVKKSYRSPTMMALVEFIITLAVVIFLVCLFRYGLTAMRVGKLNTK